MEKIQVLKPKYRTEEILKEIQECLDTSWTGMGGKAIEFEEKWKDYADFEHAHFLQSATAGLHLALKVFKEKYGWEDGDEIITTPLTFVSTNHAIMYENLKPVFADVDDSLCLDPESVLSNITDKTRAVMFVGIGGNIGQYDRLIDVCRLNNIKIILDAAHLAGTKRTRVWPEFGGSRMAQVGWESDVAVFSFQSVKNLPTSHPNHTGSSALIDFIVYFFNSSFSEKKFSNSSFLVSASIPLVKIPFSSPTFFIPSFSGFGALSTKSFASDSCISNIFKSVSTFACSKLYAENSFSA